MKPSRLSHKDLATHGLKLPDTPRRPAAPAPFHPLSAPWPQTFPRIKPLFRPVQPAANEPVILRLNSKGMFARECENLTFGAYETFEPQGPEPEGLGAGVRRSQPLRRRRRQQSPRGGASQSQALAAVSQERSQKEQSIQQARDKLFLRFPVAHAVFARRNKPVTILKQSEDCEY